MTFCVDTDIPELRRLARTIDSWREELLAYFDTGGVSNGPTEATNLLIKKIKRAAWVPQLRQLPPPADPELRRHLARSQPDTTARTLTTLNCVEPQIAEPVREGRARMPLSASWDNDPSEPVGPRQHVWAAQRACGRVGHP